MIWDPVKQFACLCKDRFGGELCEKGIPDMNVLFIMNKTLKNIVHMHQFNCFPIHLTMSNRAGTSYRIKIHFAVLITYIFYFHS